MLVSEPTPLNVQVTPLVLLALLTVAPSARVCPVSSEVALPAVLSVTPVSTPTCAVMARLELLLHAATARIAAIKSGVRAYRMKLNGVSSRIRLADYRLNQFQGLARRRRTVTAAAMAHRSNSAGSKAPTLPALAANAD